jgi:hypothetical protein
VEDRLTAGNFSSWLAEMRAALRGARASEVPCGGCTACCRASQFVHIGPDEADTLGHIPAELLFPAPGLPPGHVVMGYDERGHCPMLLGNACSIYEHRPRACRTYDCRVFAATGVEADGQPMVDAQARRWAFGFAGPADRARGRAVRAAAAFLDAHPEVLAPGAARLDATRRAVLAIETCDLFLTEGTGAGELVACEPTVEAVRVAVTGRATNR